MRHTHSYSREHESSIDTLITIMADQEMLAARAKLAAKFGKNVSDEHSRK